MGPAWIVSAVACGPATLASVSIAGSTFGYALFWVVILSALLATVAQYLAAKVGILGREGIMTLVDTHLGKGWGWALMIDAVLATWLASVIIMKALAATTSLLTGWLTPFWGVLFGAIFFLLLAAGGYRWLENICKALVFFIVICFFATLITVKPETGGVLRGLVPSIPGGIDSALMMAGIMGGAVHITIIAMHTYTVNVRHWTYQDMRLARWDTILSMFFAFGLYSAVLYLAAATVLHPKGIQVKSALDVAKTLGPLLGIYGNVIFLVGLWGAIVSTIMPTYLAAAYFISDKFHWRLDSKDRRFRWIIALGCALSVLGVFLKGTFLWLLVLMLALGLCGTPFILILVMRLLGKPGFSSKAPNSLGLKALGLATIALTIFLGVRFILEQIGVGK